MDQFKAIESVRMSVKHAKRKKEMGKKIDPGRAQLGKKIDQLVVYTSLHEAPSDRGRKVPATKMAKKILNMAILLHIMAIFPVF